MSKENSYQVILAQAKKFMSKGNVTAYIKMLVKAEQLRSMQTAV